jgi:hypothetical protein
VWNGTGVSGGVANTLLDNPSLLLTWSNSGGPTATVPGVSDTASIGNLSSAASLSQSTALTVGTLNFFSIAGSSLAFIRTNSFGSITATGPGTFAFNGAVTSVTNNSTIGEGLVYFGVNIQGGVLDALGGINFNRVRLLNTAGTLQAGGTGVALVNNSFYDVNAGRITLSGGNMTIASGSSVTMNVTNGGIINTGGGVLHVNGYFDNVGKRASGAGVSINGTIVGGVVIGSSGSAQFQHTAPTDLPLTAVGREFNITGFVTNLGRILVIQTKTSSFAPPGMTLTVRSGSVYNNVGATLTVINNFNAASGISFGATTHRAGFNISGGDLINEGVVESRSDTSFGGGASSGSGDVNTAIRIEGSMFNIGLASLTNIVRRPNVQSFTVVGLMSNSGTFLVLNPISGSAPSPSNFTANFGLLHLRNGSGFVMPLSTAGTVNLTGAGSATTPVFANRVTAANSSAINFGSATIVVRGAGSLGAPNLFEAAADLNAVGSERFNMRAFVVGVAGTSTFAQLIAPLTDPVANKAIFAENNLAILANSFFSLGSITAVASLAFNNAGTLHQATAGARGTLAHLADITNGATIASALGGTLAVNSRNNTILTNALAGRLIAMGTGSALDFVESTLNNQGAATIALGATGVLGTVSAQTGRITADGGTIIGMRAWNNSAGGTLLLMSSGVLAGATFTASGWTGGEGTITAPLDILTNTVTATASGLNLDGLVALAGGKIDGTTARNFGTLHGEGEIAAAFENKPTGVVTVTGASLQLTSSMPTVNQGRIYIGANKLDVTADWTNTGAIIINGGSVRTGGGFGHFTNAFYISTGSSIDSNFTNTGTYNLTDHSSITGNFTNAGWTNLSLYELTVNGSITANTGNGITTGVLQGSGTYTFAPASGNTTFTNDVTAASGAGGNYNTTAMTFNMDSGTINFEVLSTDMGSGAFSQLANGFAMGTLSLPNTLTLLRLLDTNINQGGGTQEAIYVENLHLGSALTASNFNFGGSSLKIYYNHIIGDGGVNFVGTYDGAERIIYFGNIIPMSAGGPPPLGVVPEPSTFALLLLGLPLLWFVWRRQRKA